MAENNKVYVTILEDRHTDVQVRAFRDREAAIIDARRTARELARRPDDFREEPLNDHMKNDGWVYYATYSVEGDCVTVVERNLL